MKFGILFSIIFLFSFCDNSNSSNAAASIGGDGTTMTTKFKVFGNCGMCKKRIQKAAKIDGVTAADWNVDSKILTISFDEKKVKPNQVQEAVAAIGHDTELYKADDAVYAELPECCQYERAN